MSFLFRAGRLARKKASRYFATKPNPASADETKYTHFGFQTVREDEKNKKVYEVFEQVAKSYDLMNDVLSLGIHRVWRDIFMMRLSPIDSTKLLDVAGGTGGIAFRFLDFVKNQRLTDCHVTVLDINAEMLKVGQRRSEKMGHDTETIDWKQGNAEELPYESNSFDAYTIAFGMRYCTHIDKVLSEAHRVLKRGGRFMCLEFGHIENPALQWVYDQYSFQMIPVLGHLLVGQWKEYQYFVESIRKFPKQEEYKELIQKAGFRLTSYENFTFGIVAIHSGFKL